MARVLTARYASGDAAHNAHEDLIDTGYPSEKVRLDREAAEVKVITSVEGEPEAREILGRHEPTEVSESRI